MTPIEILTPIVIGLAFYGYVQCLARRPWLTLALSIALAAFVLWMNPFLPEHALTWLGAVFVLFIATIAARLSASDAPAPTQRRAPQRTAQPQQKKRKAPQQKTRQAPQKTKRKKAQAPIPKDANGIAIDGTNVLFWDDNEASLATLQQVVRTLQNRSYSPYVFLDASSKHHLKKPNLDEKGFARALGVPSSNVTVCPAGTEADGFILRFAKSNAIPIVSNDRFGDRAHQVKGIKLVKGIVANNNAILEGL